MLATETLGGPVDAPRLVLAHGFTQNARCWGAFADRCAETFAVTAIDAPGHGRSGHADADLVAAGRLLVEAGGSGHYLGYSMGGRMLLHAALGEAMAPSAGSIESLVLIGATPGIASPHERVQRREADAARADHILEVGTQAFVTEWLAQPLFADLSPEQSCITERFANSPEGMAASLRHCGTGAQEPQWERLRSLALPVLVIAGTEDVKFTQLGVDMAAAIGPNARFVGVDGGHAVHLQNPAATASVVTDWIAALS